MKAIEKLRCRWDKVERDLKCFWPAGVSTHSDSAYVFYKIFPPEVTEELKKRGYDITTLKFEISPQKGNERFRSQMSNHALAADEDRAVK